MEDDTPPTPEGSMKMHQLCGSCTQFVDGISSWLGSRAGYSLCTISHLKEMDGACHLCTKIHYLFTRSEGREIRGYDKKFSMTDGYFCDEWVTLEEHSYALRSLRICLRKSPLIFSPGVLTVGFYTDVPFRAEYHVTRIQQWLQTCISTHQECKAPISAKPVRPSRILELGSLPGDQVVLRCDCANWAEFHYLALSHMWGSDPRQQLRLTESRLQEFQTEVPWDEMSFLFQEAIRITRAIKYQYLWIDSLCIIQDSQSDWNAEAARMADVYGNADCSIAYLLPPTEIQMKPRNNLQVLTPCFIRQNDQTNTGVYFEIPEHFLHEFGNQISRKDWPLFSRAWAFQEHLLSPRTIYVGHHNLIWECSRKMCDELLGSVMEIGITPSKNLFRELQSHIDNQNPDLHEAQKYMVRWESLVHHYRERKLTKSEDRIMAFAGVAQAMQRATGMSYLAGGWREHFPFCLMWALRHDKGFGESAADFGPLEEAVVHDVPSWSWFSLPIYRASKICYVLKLDHRERFTDPYPFQRTIFIAKLSSLQKSEEKQKHTLHSVFYDLSGLSITLHAMICEVNGSEILRYKFRIMGFYKYFRAQFDRIVDHLRVNFLPDQPLDNKITGNITLVLLREHNFRIFSRREHTLYRSMVGLVLLPGHGDGTYKRVGLWSVCAGRWPIYGGVSDELERNSLFEGLADAKMETITLV